MPHDDDADKVLDDDLLELFEQMEQSGQTEQMVVGECLKTIAANGGGSASRQHLLACAEELRDASQSVIDKLLPAYLVAERRCRYPAVLVWKDPDFNLVAAAICYTSEAVICAAKLVINGNVTDEQLLRLFSYQRVTVPAASSDYDDRGWLELVPHSDRDTLQEKVDNYDA